MNHNFYYRLFFLLLIGIYSSLLQPDEAKAQSNWDWDCARCNDGNPCTLDYCIYGFCINIPIRNCGNDSNCELKIVQAKTLDCYYDSNDGKSKVKLRVCLWWRNANVNRDIKVWINGQQKILDVKYALGGDCVEFIVPADGSEDNKVWAEFVGESTCKDVKEYDSPNACPPPAPCDLDITSVNVGNCYFDASDNKSKAKLEVCIEWKNRPKNEIIFVYIDGESQVVYTNPAQPNGTKCVTFTVLADGSSNNGIWASFPYGYNCKDDDKYKAPQPCYQAPPCDLDITDVGVSECYYDPYDGKSKARVNICVDWKNRPAGQSIIVSITGQSQTIYPSSTNGTQCVEFTILANGSSNNGIWAKFQNSPSCQDEDKYKSPQPCPPNCKLDITSVNVGDCYYDSYTGTSKAKLTICLKWENRPGNENIMVSINGQALSFAPGTSSGTKCVEFIIAANGTTYNGIWAKFQYTNACQDESKYHAPQPCYQTPQCDLDITSVNVSSCYYDHADYKSKAKLTICVQWKNRPGNENIMVSINGQNKTIATTTTNGSACVEFIIPANGIQNNGIWAKFQYSPACQDEDKYHAPQPCYETPECDLDIYSVSVGNCYYDAGSSKAKLTICVKWNNRPNNENIMVSINGQAKIIYPNGSSGTQCVDFIVPANGTYNNGIWAKFQYSASCQDEDKYHTPQPCYQTPQCDLDITSVSVGNCYYDSYSSSSKAKLTICVQWKNRPNNENIMVSINGQTKTLVITTANGSACVEFIIPANGIQNNGIWAKFQYTASCQDEDKYHAPQPCYQAPQCDLDITSVNVGNCYYDHADYTSKAKLTICVEWKNRPANENIMVSINGQTKTIYPNSANGTACVEFIIASNGVHNNGIWAKFQYTASCQDEAFYTAPYSCYEAPPCDVDIKSVSVGDCYYDHADYKSKAKLTICVQWNGRPGNENIMVSINGQTKTIYPNATSGSACVEFIIPANGVYNNGIWAKFQYSSGCQDEGKYNAPQSCYEAPPCELDIKSVSVGNCYYDQYDNKSKAKLTICVEWKNRPDNENIMVSINGQTKTIYPSAYSGSQCVDFTVLSNGTHNNGIWAKFQYSASCQDEAFYQTPQPCYQAPPCDLDITSVSVGNCYYDGGSSKAKLTVCVEWKNRPTNEKIYVSISGQAKVITTNLTNGSVCVEFIVPANGIYNNGIWAKLEYTTTCQDEAFYHTPQPCYQAPACDLDITSVSVGNCYYEGGSSKAKLTVCVQWKNRPANENIYVTIDGQTKIISPGSANGSACVEFIVSANGSYNNGIWAKFQYTQSCQDEAFYHCPQPCYQAPACDLDITSVSVGNCYYDGGSSKAKLTVCVQWKNRPGNENIMVSIDGQTKTISPGSANGSACVEFIVSANGSYNNGIWAKFQYTASCQDEAFYHCPQPCYQAPACDLDITSVSVGNCYYDGGSSKVKLTVCVQWKNRPGNENIMVSIDGQTKTISPGSANGSACVEFIVSANGSYNNGIWAKFQYTASCQDEAFFHCPQPCYQAPACALDIYKVEVSQCYFDHADYKSKVKLKVCIQWNNAPAGEKIKLTTGNQGKLIAFSAPNGSVCVEFIVSANGVNNQGIWAKFEYTQSCQDEAFYNAPYPCEGGYGREVNNSTPAEAEGDNLNNATKTDASSVQPETDDVTIEELAVVEIADKPTAILKDIRVFPNPTRDELNVDVTAFIGKTANIQVFNTVGQLMYQTTIDEVNTDKLQLDVSQFASEVYFLKVQIPNEGTYTAKFIVRK